MTFDIISDTHFNVHLAFEPKLLEERFDKRFMPVFERSKRSDNLIIAGDIGEYNVQNLATLRLVRDKVGYRNIIMVLGNHDLFLPNRIAMDDYETSANRVNEFKEMIAREEGMHLLDGDVIEIDGIRIGGAIGWYDGSYVYHNLNPYYTKSRDYLNRLYWEANPDPHHIIGMGLEDEFDALLEEQLSSLQKIYKNVNVMITHINPSIRPEHTQRRYSMDDTTGFFTFDGAELLKNGSMSHWIFGHQHTQAEFERYGVKCICNAFGNAGEWLKDFKLKTIDIKEKSC